jgi:hypothetical protein
VFCAEVFMRLSTSQNFEMFLGPERAARRASENEAEVCAELARDYVSNP